MRIASVNVNGVRAAFRKGMGPWLDAREVDVLALQEVRAEREDLEALLGNDWVIAHDAATAKGRAGVAIATRVPHVSVSTKLGPASLDTAGRWIETDITTPLGNPLTIVSCYVHSGEVDTPKQAAKYEFLTVMTKRMKQLGASDKAAVVVGDLNVGHRTLDIRNWKGNKKNSGFLPEERAYFDQWMGHEEDDDYNTGTKGRFVDIGRLWPCEHTHRARWLVKAQISSGGTLFPPRIYSSVSEGETVARSFQPFQVSRLWQ